MSSKSKIHSSARNTKFEEEKSRIQRKNLETLKSFEDSSDDEIDNEVDRKTLSGIFSSYEGSDVDVANIKQFFENGESIDCLICKSLQKKTEFPCHKNI